MLPALAAVVAGATATSYSAAATLQPSSSPLAPDSCADAPSVSGRYAASDPAWTAEELITVTEAMRAQLRVPFYMYDGIIDGVDFDDMHRNLLEECSFYWDDDPLRGLETKPFPQYTRPDVSFIETMRSHPWRVKRSEDADIIVLPIAFSYAIEQRFPQPHGLGDNVTKRIHTEWPNCWYDADAMAHAVRTTELFRRRERDHLLVSRHWYSNVYLQTWANYPPIFANVRLATNERSQGHMTSSEDALRSLSPLDDNLVSPYPTGKVGAGDCSLDPAKRTVSFFFGGQTEGTHHGCRSLRSERRTFPEPTSPVTSSLKPPPPALQSHPPAQTVPMLVRLPDYIRQKVFADRRRLPADAILIASGDAAYVNATAIETLPECPATFANVTCAQCQGKYRPADILPRTEFLLAPRGDTPSSDRLYEAAQYCNIPLLLSDQQFEVGTPFQCLVPYQLFTVAVAERAFLRDGTDALRSATGGLSRHAINRMRALIAHYRRDLLWDLPGNRVAENILLDASRTSGAHSCCLFGDRLNATVENRGFRTEGCSNATASDDGVATACHPVNLTDALAATLPAAPC